MQNPINVTKIAKHIIPKTVSTIIDLLVSFYSTYILSNKLEKI
mgnify:CR=1 FL=1